MLRIGNQPYIDLGDAVARREPCGTMKSLKLLRTQTRAAHSDITSTHTHAGPSAKHRKHSKSFEVADRPAAAFRFEG